MGVCSLCAERNGVGESSVPRIRTVKFNFDFIVDLHANPDWIDTAVDEAPGAAHISNVANVMKPNEGVVWNGCSSIAGLQSGPQLVLACVRCCTDVTKVMRGLGEGMVAMIVVTGGHGSSSI